jgi:SAM-dependent methyltransferase
MTQQEKSKAQAITIQTYEENWENYISGTVSEIAGEYKDWIDKVLSFINKDSVIFEVGSASGRDADYIENLGFHVVRSDVAASFVNYQKNLGKESIKFDLLKDEFNSKYDLIFANVVLLHFNPEELVLVLENIKKGLKNRGLFAFTTKSGNGEEFSTHKMNSARYFKYWEINELKNDFIDLGFKIEVFQPGVDSKWIQGIVRFIE